MNCLIRLYDERRIEAASSLEDTRTRRRSIDTTVDVIIQRMNELRVRDQRNEK